MTMTLIVEKDYGTQQKTSDQAVELEIDGAKVFVPAGTSVMRAARTIDKDIPSLCASDCLEAFG